MKKQSLKYIAASLTILSCISAIPRKAIAATISDMQTNKQTFYITNRNKGTGIFNEENLKYLSSEQQRQLKEIQNCKDTGKKLSDEQQKNLNSLVDCVIKGKLGNEKYKDFKALMEKKNNDKKLTEDESKRLKEYKKLMHDCDDCSNDETLKQFLR